MDLVAEAKLYFTFLIYSVHALLFYQKQHLLFVYFINKSRETMTNPHHIDISSKVSAGCTGEINTLFILKHKISARFSHFNLFQYQYQI